MRKVILCLAASFDGFIEGPNGEIDWIVFDKDGGSDLTEFLTEIDTVLYGRISYELWGNYPLTDESSDFEKRFYGRLNRMDRYVFSHTKNQFEGNATVVSEIPSLIEQLRQKPGKHIWLYGGASLITSFMNLGLVDEFRIAVMPIILGNGKPLFKHIGSRTKLKLSDVKTSPSGVFAVTYQTDRES